MVNTTAGNIFRKQNPWNLTETLDEVSFHGPMDVIQGLSHFKSSLVSFPKVTVEQKIEWLERINDEIQKRQQRIVQSEALYQGLPESFVMEHVFQWSQRHLQSYLEEIKKNPQLQFRPVGLVCLLPSWQMGFRQITESIIPALLTGNCVVVKSDPQSRVSAQIWKDILISAQTPENVVQFFEGDHQLGLFMMKHPSFKTICFSGTTDFIEKNWPALPLLRKNFSFSLSTKNSMAILPEATDETILAGLMSCWIGWGELRSNMHRIFCTEKDFERVKNLVDKKLTQINWSDHHPESSLVGVPLIHPESKWKDSLRDEGSTILNPKFDQENQPMVCFNLSNCSPWQQDPAPLISINSVKYVHEMAKWINNGYLSHSALVLGPEEKAMALAAKLEVSWSWMNEWLQTTDSRMIVHGQKLSYKGDVLNDLKSKLWQY